MKPQIIVFVFLIVMLLFSCKKEKLVLDRFLDINFAGQVVKIESLGEYFETDAVQILGMLNPSSTIQTSCGFTMYRISYKTQNFDGSEVIVSGLLALPKTHKMKGIVSWQHGTNTFRPNSISKPTPNEGVGISALFASDGYLLLAPDYIGLGVSTHVHPYYHVKSTTNAIIDFIKIGEKILHEFSDANNQILFLTGFSQGGAATVATQRQLEINNPTQLQIKGVASIAGAYNLKNISLPYILQRNHVNSIIYLGYLSHAYSKIYNVPLNSFVKEPYASILPSYFDGTKDGKFIAEHLPSKPINFFTNEFYSELINNIPNWFSLALEENETYRWKPLNELRLYYGELDEDVIPQEAIAAHHYMLSIGGNVRIQNLGQYNHNSIFLQALPLVKYWFNSVNKL